MKFGEILKGADKEGKEKHVPIIELDKCDSEVPNVVRVIVGKEVPHPNTVEHHIAWIELYGIKKEGQVIFLGRAEFAPSFTKPNARFYVNVADFKEFIALEYCNIHGVWENTLAVEQSAGGNCCCCGN